MRVTHIITRLIVGGAQENTIGSVLGLRRRGHHEVDLVSGPTLGPEGSLVDRLSAAPGALTIVPHLIRPVHPLSDLLALAHLTRLLRQRQPDLVHTHSGKAGVLGRLAAHRARIPLIVHTIHGPSFGPFQGRLPNFLFRQAERLAARHTTHFVSVAHAMTRQYLAAGIGRPEQFTWIPSGFDLEPFLHTTNDTATRARFGFGPGDFIVGKIARLAPRKGHEDLLAIAPELFHRQPNLKFLLVGDGPERTRLEARIRAQGWTNRAAFAGLVPPLEIPALIGIMDVVMHLSRREGLPRALTQAMAAGRPVVAYDCDGAGEVCRSDDTGFLVAPGDHADLRRRLLQLAADPVLRARLGEHGKAWVHARFSIEHMLDGLEALYERLQAARLAAPFKPPRRSLPA